MVEQTHNHASETSTPGAGGHGHGDYRRGPLAGLIAFSARNWLLTLMVVAAATFWGYRSLVGAPLDAIPDLSDVQGSPVTVYGCITVVSQMSRCGYCVGLSFALLSFV